MDRRRLALLVTAAILILYGVFLLQSDSASNGDDLPAPEPGATQAVASNSMIRTWSPPTSGTSA